MGAEEESVEQAAANRRERLKALRAAKELLSTPDDHAASAAAPPAEHPPEEYGGGESRLEGPAEVDGTKEAIAEEDSVSQAAAAHRDRPKVLGAAKELLSTPDEDSLQTDGKIEDSEDAEEEERLNVKFRNYLPHDKQLQEHKLAPPVLPKFEDPVAATPPQEIEDPFVNIAPKKPNWDLRRDLQKKLDKLERRTQKALYQLYQEQEKERQALEGENGGETIPED